MKPTNNYQAELAVRRAITGLLGLPRHSILTDEDHRAMYQLIGKLAVIGKQYRNERKQ